MASITKESNGRKTIQFVASDGKRRSLRLGQATMKVAQEVATKVEYLNAGIVAGVAMDADTARWVAEIGDDLAEKLAAVGLIAKRHRVPAESLGNFLDEYIGGRAKLKPNTARNYKQSRKLLERYFGRDKLLRDLSPGDADQWRESLLARGLSEATVSREVKRAKQFFRAAVRKRLLQENPFADLATPAQVNPSREHFVTRDVIEKVIDACPDAQWRLIIALSRYGGLRCPSEHLALTWGDIDWERNRINVRSPKTEHYRGGESRPLPLFPELRPYLEEVFELAEPGTQHVITRYRDGSSNLRTQFLRIIGRAGVEAWPKLFHNLRASRETELSENFPIHVVCAWIGNSETIAAKHYLQVTDDHFARAAAGAQKAVQNPVQYAAEPACVVPQFGLPHYDKTPVLPGFASPCDYYTYVQVPPRGVEPRLPD